MTYTYTNFYRYGACNGKPTQADVFCLPDLSRDRHRVSAAELSTAGRELGMRRGLAGWCTLTLGTAHAKFRDVDVAHWVRLLRELAVWAKESANYARNPNRAAYRAALLDFARGADAYAVACYNAGLPKAERAYGKRAPATTAELEALVDEAMEAAGF